MQKPAFVNNNSLHNASFLQNQNNTQQKMLQPLVEHSKASPARMQKKRELSELTQQFGQTSPKDFPQEHLKMTQLRLDIALHDTSHFPQQVDELHQTVSQLQQQLAEKNDLIEELKKDKTDLRLMIQLLQRELSKYSPSSAFVNGQDSAPSPAVATVFAHNAIQTPVPETNEVQYLGQNVEGNNLNTLSQVVLNTLKRENNQDDTAKPAKHQKTPGESLERSN